MKLLLLPYAGWAGLVQLAGPIGLASDLPRLIATASVLGSLTVLVYRLGVWRQEMENTRTNVGAEVRSHREESASSFAQLERRVDALEHMATDSREFKQRAARWYQRSVRRLERLEERSE